MKRKQITPKLILLVVLATAIAFAVGGCSKDKTTTPVNHAPVIASVTVSPNSVAYGGTATVTVLATDADGDVLTYTFTVTGGSISQSGATATWSLPSSAGNFAVNVSVTDGKATTVGTGGCTVQTPLHTDRGNSQASGRTSRQFVQHEGVYLSDG